MKRNRILALTISVCMMLITASAVWADETDGAAAAEAEEIIIDLSETEDLQEQQSVEENEETIILDEQQATEAESEVLEFTEADEVTEEITDEEDLLGAVTNTQIVNLAKSKINCKYVLGGKGPNSFDCSGFVYWVFKQYGISLPAGSWEYYNNPTKYGTLISEKNALPGDVISWAGHVGIYIGNGQMVNALNPKYGVCTLKVSGFIDGNGVQNPTHKYIRIKGVTYGNVHTHAYNMRVASDTYLKSAASGSTPAVYYQSCICGAKGTATFSFSGCTSGQYKGHIYEVYNFSKGSWSDAKAYAASKGGHLVTITTKDEQNYVTSLIQKDMVMNQYAIGLTDEGQAKGQWKWITGEKFSYSNWDPQAPEPSNGSSERYVYIIGKGNGTTKQTGEWNDDADAGTAATYYNRGYAGFIIEYDPLTMYRVYNPNSGEHFYTADKTEKNNLVRIGWKDEGIGWTAPKKSQTPVYRVYNPNAGDHHYTSDRKEKDMLVKVGWKYEKIGWYSDDLEGVPLYRQYNPNAVSGAHNYTTRKAENDMLVKMGWKAEGIGWYGVKQ